MFDGFERRVHVDALVRKRQLCDVSDFVSGVRQSRCVVLSGERDTIYVAVDADILFRGKQERAVPAAHRTVEYNLPAAERPCQRVAEQMILRSRAQSTVWPRKVML